MSYFCHLLTILGYPISRLLLSFSVSLPLPSLCPYKGGFRESMGRDDGLSDLSSTPFLPTAHVPTSEIRCPSPFLSCLIITSACCSAQYTLYACLSVKVILISLGQCAAVQSSGHIQWSVSHKHGSFIGKTSGSEFSQPRWEVVEIHLNL